MALANKVKAKNLGPSNWWTSSPYRWIKALLASNAKNQRQSLPLECTKSYRNTTIRQGTCTKPSYKGEMHYKLNTRLHNPNGRYKYVVEYNNINFTLLQFKANPNIKWVGKKSSRDSDLHLLTLQANSLPV